MALNVGTLVAFLTLDTKGFTKGTDQIPTKMESSTKSGFSKAIGIATRGMAIIGGLVTGVALAGGVSRALNIEDAKAKLKGLGHSTSEVKEIMNDALKSVKGTSFGLDDAATVAASAVASGIKPGKDLTKYLKEAADAATITGSSMGGMGGIMDKVQAKGHVFTDSLNQLSDQGLPIFSWLQKEYGVSADKLQSMVQNGQVDAKHFQKAIHDNIGGAALSAGDTTRGAWANMKAAWSRGGATIVSGVMPKLKKSFKGIEDDLDSMKPVFTEVGKVLGTVFSDLIATIKWIAGNMGWIGPLVIGIGSAVAAWKTYQVIMGIVKGVQLAYAATVGGSLAAQAALTAAKETDTVVTNASAIATGILNAVMYAMPIMLIVVGIGLLVAGIILLITHWKAVSKFIITVWKAALAWVTTALNIFVGWWNGVWKGIVSFFVGTWKSILTGVKAGWNAVLHFFQGIPGAIRGFFSGVGTWLLTMGSDLLHGLHNGITRGWDKVMSFFRGLPGKVGGFFSGAGTWLWDAGASVVQGLLDGLKSLAGTVGSFFLSLLPGWIVGPFKMALGIGSPSKLFKSFGGNIGQGLIDGLKDIQPVIDQHMKTMVAEPNAVAFNATADANARRAGNGQGNSSKVLNYYAPAGSKSLSGEEQLYAALGTSRGGF